MITFILEIIPSCRFWLQSKCAGGPQTVVLPGHQFCSQLSSDTHTTVVISRAVCSGVVQKSWQHTAFVWCNIWLSSCEALKGSYEAFMRLSNFKNMQSQELTKILGFWIWFCSHFFWLLGDKSKRRQWKADIDSASHMFWIKSKTHYYSTIKNIIVSALRIRALEGLDFKTSTYHNLQFSPKFFQFSHRLKPPISALQIPLALEPKLPKPLKFNLQDKDIWHHKHPWSLSGAGMG